MRPANFIPPNGPPVLGSIAVALGRVLVKLRLLKATEVPIINPVLRAQLPQSKPPPLRLRAPKMDLASASVKSVLSIKSVLSVKP